VARDPMTGPLVPLPVPWPDSRPCRRNDEKRSCAAFSITMDNFGSRRAPRTGWWNSTPLKGACVVSNTLDADGATLSDDGDFRP